MATITFECSIAKLNYNDCISFIQSKNIAYTKVIFGNGVTVESDDPLTSLERFTIENYIHNGTTGLSQDNKTKNLIMSEIFNGIADQDQQARMLNLLDTKVSFIVFLDSSNYSGAKAVALSVLTEQADIDLINSIIPS